MTAANAANLATEAFAFLMAGMVLIVCVQSGKEHQHRGYALFVWISVCCMVTQVTLALATVWSDRPDDAAFIILQILSSTLFFVILFLWARYLMVLTFPANRAPAWLQWVNAALCIIGAVLWAISMSSDLLVDYHGTGFTPGRYYLLGQIPGVLYIILDLGIIAARRKYLSRREMLALIAYIMIPIGAIVVHYFFQDLMLHYPALSFSLLLVYLTIHARREDDLRRTLEITQAELVVRQISPHFIFNTLNAIYYLCETDPAAAQEGIDLFSNYLRENIDETATTEPIPFTTELRHIQTYLDIQSMRLGERLDVEYDLAVTDFSVPVFTVEPLVENAVRHGIAKKPEGGTVWLSTSEEDGRVRIEVRDNGVGFEPLPEDDGRHLGLRSVRLRLGDIPGASFDIQSEKGVGTTATVVLPSHK